MLGTAAFTDPELLDEALAAFTARVLVGVDVRGGQVSVAGWTRETQMRGEDAIRLHAAARRDALRLHERRPRRDARGPRPGRGPARRRRPCAGASSTRAGSARSTTSQALRDLRLVNLAGVISGKALYERRFTVAEAQAGSLDG